jgi:hypothetical protein
MFRDVEYSVSAMAERQDERTQMIFGESEWDDVQLNLVNKVYNPE